MAREQPFESSSAANHRQYELDREAGELDDAGAEERAWARNGDGIALPLSDEQINQALGWFSIGLGLVEMLAPRAFGRTIGVGEHPTAIRLCGVREIASGVGLLTQRAPAAFAWSRVAGDAMDLSLLAAAATSRDGDRERIAAAATAVLGVTALDVYASQRQTQTSLAAAPQAVPVKKSITINATPEEIYSFWRNFENLPRFMKHLESVTLTGDRTSHWVACAPAGVTVEWDAEIVDDRPNELLAWRTLPASQVPHHGTVRFEPASAGRGTVVRVDMQYGAPGGELGVRIAKLFGEEPELQVDEDLRRLKQLIETGEIATTRGQSSGLRSWIGRATLGRRLS